MNLHTYQQIAGNKESVSCFSPTLVYGTLPECSSAISKRHALAIDSIRACLQILIDIKKRMSSADMGLVTQSLH